MLADPAVLEEHDLYDLTPLIYAIAQQQPAIALWLIEHRGGHSLDTRDGNGYTALTRASQEGLLAVVQALVGAGATFDSADHGSTHLHTATPHPDVLAYLLTVQGQHQLLNYYSGTALSHAAAYGSRECVRLLLDAGADPTVPKGRGTPLGQGGDVITRALLRTAIFEPERAHALLDASLACPRRCLWICWST